MIGINEENKKVTSVYLPAELKEKLKAENLSNSKLVEKLLDRYFGKSKKQKLFKRRFELLEKKETIEAELETIDRMLYEEGVTQMADKPFYDKIEYNGDDKNDK